VALTEDECQKCRSALGQLKAEYGGAGEVPEVKARLGEVEAALERECSGSSDSGAALVSLVVFGAGVVGIGLLAALFGDRE